MALDLAWLESRIAQENAQAKRLTAAGDLSGARGHAARVDRLLDRYLSATAQRCPDRSVVSA